MTEQRPTWAAPDWGDEVVAKVGDLPAWILDALPPLWWELGLTALLALDETALIAAYRASRAVAGSRAGRMAAAAMVQRYREGVLFLVRRYLQAGRDEQEFVSQAWLAFFAAVEAFSPQHKSKLMTFAAYRIKEALIRQLIGTLPQEPHSDDTRKAWDRTIATWARLAQEWGRAPSPDEVAEQLGPQLLPAIATVERARRAILDVFRVLVDNRVVLGEPEEQAEEPEGMVEVGDATWEPERILEREEERRESRSEVDRVFAEAQEALSDLAEARKLVALRVLLNVKESDQDTKQDYGMYKVRGFINDAPDEIVARWAALWTDYGLGRLGLPQSWEKMRRMFEPPVEVAELRRFYNFGVQAAGWDRPRGR